MLPIYLIFKNLGISFTFIVFFAEFINNTSCFWYKMLFCNTTL